jgi:hypothetical protein
MMTDRKQRPLPVRDRIIRKRKAAIGFAMLDAAVIAAVYGYVAAGWPAWPLAVVVAIPFAVGLALNSVTALKGRRILRDYDANPAVAFLAEIRNALKQGDSE